MIWNIAVVLLVIYCVVNAVDEAMRYVRKHWK